MTEGEKLIAALVASKQIENLYLIEDLWLSKQEKQVVRFIRDYTAKYDKIPPLKTIIDDTGADIELSRGLNFDHALQNVKKRFVYTELQQKVPDAMKLLRTDPKAVLTELAKVVENLMTDDSVIQDVYYHSDAKSRYSAYTERTKNKGVTYISCGNPLLDDIFLGWGRTDLITLGGKPGSKKSWAALYLMLIAERTLPPELGPIMFVSNEMNSTELIERLDALQFELPYSDFLRGKLSRKQRKQYLDGLEQIELLRSRILIVYGCNTLMNLEHKIKRYNPSMVFADGSYLFEPEMEEGMAKTVYITRKLKQLCLKGVPILQTTQLRKNTSKKASKTMYDAQEDFYYGSYIQDSDTAIRTYIPPEMIYRESVAWQIAKARKIDPNTQIEFFSSLQTMKFGFAKLDVDDDNPAPVAPPPTMAAGAIKNPMIDEDDEY